MLLEFLTRAIRREKPMKVIQIRKDTVMLSLFAGKINVHVTLFLNDSKECNIARCCSLVPVILTSQDADIRRIEMQSRPGIYFARPYLENTHYKKGLVEWLNH
jgi:hypothetical protein